MRAITASISAGDTVTVIDYHNHNNIIITNILNSARGTVIGSSGLYHTCSTNSSSTLHAQDKNLVKHELSFEMGEMVEDLLVNMTHSVLLWPRFALAK